LAEVKKILLLNFYVKEQCENRSVGQHSVKLLTTALSCSVYFASPFTALC